MRHIAILTAMFCLCGVTLSFAELTKEEKMLFNEKNTYDIYYQISSESASVIEDAVINDVKSISGKQFLTYTKDSFGKLNNRDYGFIDFHSIKAIHPSGISAKILISEAYE